MKRSAKQFARGQRGGIFTVSMPAPARTASNEVVNLGGPAFPDSCYGC
jgi:hypothetical protein